jgi:phospholipase C
MSQAVMSRRRFLRGGAGLVGASAAFSVLSPASRAALASVAPPGSTLQDIEHVVVFCQENRSFDHYFGTLPGVIGWDDPDAYVDPQTGRSVFEQVDPNPLDGANGTLLPWRLDPTRTSAQCLADVDHLWQTQHLAYAGGTNALFATTHTLADPLFGDQDPTQGGIRTMSYFTRADLPFHYALADAFTICDRYFCSVLGPTIPNRLYLMSAWLDPAGTHGGPEVNNIKQMLGTTSFSWTTYPEQLEARGIDWKIYRERDCYEENVVDYFRQYQDPSTELFRRGRGTIADGQLIAELRKDVVSGNLPQVSWIVGPEHTTEHPHQLPADGAAYTQGILEALTADPKVWAKTLLIITYDENGGFFDHVIPPVAPPGEPGEHLTGLGLALAPEAAGVTGPIGLGYRVPTLLVSPFTRGGYVCSDTFDHTSVLRLLETRFGAEIPNITRWRRQTCGDLASAIPLGCAPDTSLPELPDAAELLQEALDQCGRLPVPKVPVHQEMPTQEAGARRRIGAGCAPVAAAGGAAVPGSVAGPGDDGPELPLTGRSGPGLLVTAGAAAAALALRRLGRAGAPEPRPDR